MYKANQSQLFENNGIFGRRCIRYPYNLRIHKLAPDSQLEIRQRRVTASFCRLISSSLPLIPAMHFHRHLKACVPDLRQAVKWNCEFFPVPVLDYTLFCGVCLINRDFVFVFVRMYEESCRTGSYLKPRSCSFSYCVFKSCCSKEPRS